MRKSGLTALFMLPLLPLLALAAYNPLQTTQAAAQGQVVRAQAAPQAGRGADQSPWPTTPARRPALGADWV